MVAERARMCQQVEQSGLTRLSCWAQPVQPRCLPPLGEPGGDSINSFRPSGGNLSTGMADDILVIDHRVFDVLLSLVVEREVLRRLGREGAGTEPLALGSVVLGSHVVYRSSNHCNKVRPKRVATRYFIVH